MLIYVFPPHYQLVYINLNISSFSVISYTSNVQLTLNSSKYLVHFCSLFSIISQKRPFSHTVLQFDKKNGV